MLITHVRSHARTLLSRRVEKQKQKLLPQMCVRYDSNSNANDKTSFDNIFFSFPIFCLPHSAFLGEMLEKKIKKLQ